MLRVRYITHDNMDPSGICYALMSVVLIRYSMYMMFRIIKSSIQCTLTRMGLSKESNVARHQTLFVQNKFKEQLGKF